MRITAHILVRLGGLASFDVRAAAPKQTALETANAAAQGANVVERDFNDPALASPQLGRLGSSVTVRAEPCGLLTEYEYHNHDSLSLGRTNILTSTVHSSFTEC